jgi:UDP-N-acetylmuramoylalanine--D-glutamate ligase
VSSSSELQLIFSHPVLILGLGTTGRSVLYWLLHRGMDARLIFVHDEAWTTEKRTECEALGVHTGELALSEISAWQAFLEPIRTVIVSPGVFPTHPVRQLCRDERGERRCINDIQLWWWAVQSTEPKILGITGSNGKSTVTAWAAQVAQSCGYSAVAAGNIGLPVLDVLRDIEQEKREALSVWVLELSSFQLEDCEPLPFTASTVLNLSEDHLDYHGSMAAYRLAKERILWHSQSKIIPYGYVFSDASSSISESGCITFGVAQGYPTEKSQPVWSLYQKALWYRDRLLMPQSRLSVLGDHNALNALVVLALLEAIGVDVYAEAVHQAMADFKGLAHRVVKIAEYQDVDFIEDSKGTNVGATVAALEGLGSRYSKLLLIAGGDGKGQDFSPLVEPILLHCRKVLLIGRDAPLLEKQLATTTVEYQHYDSLEQAVESGFAEALPGEALVLSPACASWDMFRNYLHRAEVFYQSVHRCIERAQYVSTH